MVGFSNLANAIAGTATVSYRHDLFMGGTHSSLLRSLSHVSELAANVGMPKPKVYIVNNGSTNAFATGRTAYCSGCTNAGHQPGTRYGSDDNRQDCDAQVGAP